MQSAPLRTSTCTLTRVFAVELYIIIVKGGVIVQTADVLIDEVTINVAKDIAKELTDRNNIMELAAQKQVCPLIGGILQYVSVPGPHIILPEVLLIFFCAQCFCAQK